MASFDEAIPPGQAGKVRATMRTDHFQGQVNRAISLRTNDPEHPSAVLKLQVMVVGSVVLLPQPEMVIGSGMSRSQRPRVIVRKDLRERGDLVISDLRASQPWLGVKAHRVETPEPAHEGLPPAAKGDWILEVAFDGKPPSGVRREKVTFKTGLSVEKEVTVPVLVTVLPNITVRPRRLTLKHVAGSEGVEGSILAVVKKGLDADALVVKAVPESIHLNVDRTGPRQFRVRVSVPGGGPPGFDEGHVTLKVDDESVDVAVHVEAAAAMSP